MSTQKHLEERDKLLILKRNGYVEASGSKSSHIRFIKGNKTFTYVRGKMSTMTFIAECKRCGIDMGVLDKEYYKKVFKE